MQATIELLALEPALSGELLIDSTGQSSSAAYLNVAALEAIGTLKRTSTVKDRKIWVAVSIMEALENFALRAGQRVRR